VTPGNDVSAAKQTPPGRSPGFRLGVAILAAGAVVFGLKASPLFDPGVDELWQRLSAIRDQTSVARDNPEGWRQFADQASLELRQIADEARRAHQRRLGPWRWLASDRREELALKEAQRIAEGDLPALIAAGPKSSPLRQRSVDDALGRLDDHLAGASPYLPPFLPVEDQAGLDGNAGTTKPWPAWLVGVGIADTALLVIVLAWWLTRSRRAASRQRRMV
jgi:hypothetical protein